MLVNFGALLGSALGRNIVWRSVAYTMYSRTKTAVHRPQLPHPAADPAEPPVAEDAEPEPAGTKAKV